MTELSWHQMNAIRRNNELRNHDAHIWGDDYIASGKALCGAKDFRVHVDRRHAHKPENKTCKKCLAKLGPPVQEEPRYIPPPRPPKPEGATQFYRDYGYYPAKVIEWGWSTDFGRWGALVEFEDGAQIYTYPKL